MVRGHTRIYLVHIAPAVVKNTTEEVFIVGRRVDHVAEGVVSRRQFGRNVEPAVELEKRNIKEEMDSMWNIFKKKYIGCQLLFLFVLRETGKLKTSRWPTRV